jgi:DNA-binding MarR family transcriptional regulator
VPDEREQLVSELTRESRLMARQLVRFYDAVADQLGLHVSDLTCLGALRDRGRAGVGELATELGLTTGAVSRMVDRLEAGKFVHRVPDPVDGRKVIVELSSREPLAGLFAGHAASITESVADFSEPELRLLLAYVRDRTAASRSDADRLRREGKPHATRRARS